MSSYLKPLIIGGLIIGGILFGASMAILGKCPGTGPVSISEGRIDVLIGAIGGIFGAFFFTKYYDSFFKILAGKSHGNESLINVSGDYGAIMVLLFGIALIVFAIMIPHRELLDEADLSQLEADERAEIESNGKFEIIK